MINTANVIGQSIDHAENALDDISDVGSHLMGISLSATSWWPMYLESPVFLVASARAKPPPSRRITPQGRRFSTGNNLSK